MAVLPEPPAPRFHLWLPGRGLLSRTHHTGDHGPVITKTGNARVRRVLAESAWTYRYPARLGKTACSATRHMPEAVRETAWKAQARRTKRCRARVARGRRSTVATPAVARALVGFMWAIARMQPAMQPART